MPMVSATGRESTAAYGAAPNQRPPPGRRDRHMTAVTSTLGHPRPKEHARVPPLPVRTARRAPPRRRRPGHPPAAPAGRAGAGAGGLSTRCRTRRATAVSTSATPRLTRTAVRHLATVLPCERGAVVAMIGPRAVGLAQWARYADERHVADVAVAVGDRHQKRGLGAALVAAGAAAAARSGASHVAATVHPESRTVLGWLLGAGAVPRPGHAGRAPRRGDRAGRSPRRASEPSASASPHEARDRALGAARPAGPVRRALHGVERRAEGRPVPAAVLGDVGAGGPDRDRHRAGAGQPVDAGAVAAQVASVGPRATTVVRVRRHVDAVVGRQKSPPTASPGAVLRKESENTPPASEAGIVDSRDGPGAAAVARVEDPRRAATRGQPGVAGPGGDQAGPLAAKPNSPSRRPASRLGSTTTRTRRRCGSR